VILLFGVLAMQARTSVAEINDGAPLPRHVEIKMVAPSESWPALQAVLSELLTRLQVSVRFASIPSVEARQIMNERSDDPPSVARVWIDMRDPTRVTLYLTGDRADRLLVRHVPLVTRLDEVAREEIAHIVEATVDALLVGGRIGVVTDEVMPSKMKEEPRPQERLPGVTLDLGVGYEAQVWSSFTRPLHTAAAFVGVEARTGQLRPGVWASGEYRFPTTLEHELVTARLDQGSVRVVATLGWTPSRKWLVGVGLGGGFDIVRIAANAASQGGAMPAPDTVALEDPRVAVVPMLRAMAFAKYAISTRTDIFIGLGGDYDLYGTRYLLRDPNTGTDIPIFEPWRVRPTAMIGVSSDVLAH
jgi:hypothetical protein